MFLLSLSDIMHHLNFVLHIKYNHAIYHYFSKQNHFYEVETMDDTQSIQNFVVVWREAVRD